MEKIKVLQGGTSIEIDATFINDYQEGSKIFYCQDKLAITDENNNVISSYDIIPVIDILRIQFNKHNENLLNKSEGNF